MMKIILMGFMLIIISCVPQTSGEGRGVFGISSFSTDEEIPNLDTDPIRPSNAVFIEPSYCVCKFGRPFIIGSACAPICQANQSINDNRYMLFGNARLGPEITLDPFFQNGLIDWCKRPMPNIDANQDGIVETLDSGPDCEMEIEEKFTTFTNRGFLQMLIGTTNNFQMDLTPFNIQEGKTYRLRMRALSSLTEAYSDYIEFQVNDGNGPFNYGGLLSINQIRRYQCLFKTGPNQSTFENIFNRHYFFDSAYDPPPLPAGVRNVVCHNDGLGADDQVQFPRLDESNAFRLWDHADRRFSVNFPDGIDNEGNDFNQNDINYFVTRLMEQEHQTIITGDVFVPLSLTVFPGTQNISSISRNIGYVLLPTESPDRQDLICPTNANLALARANPSSYKLFDVLDEFIDDSEGLYIALREPRETDPISGQTVDDVLYINESSLQNIWFSYDNSSNPVAGPKSADADYLQQIRSKTMYFYWPIVGGDPLIQTPGQKIYKVVTVSELDSQLNGLPPSNNGPAPAPDKKIACIPKAN